MSIVARWRNWEEILPYKEQLIRMEYDLIKKYHYPEREIPIEYVQNSVDKLKMHLEDGNTYFWAITDNDELIGYYWAYTTSFIEKKRWILRSLMIKEKYTGKGIGTTAINEGLKKARELNCYDSSTEYVPFNEAAGKAYEKAGYQVSRIEVTKVL